MSRLRLASSNPEPMHAAFAARLNQAADDNPSVPDFNHGRYPWFIDQMNKHGVTVTKETIRKWFYGITRPTPRKAAALATVLQVDEGWLVAGSHQTMTPREQRARNAAADGVVNIVAGMIRVDGGAPAFPDDGDDRAAKDHIDLYAVIRGAQYHFHITAATRDDGKVALTVPRQRGPSIVLAVLREGGLHYRVFEVPDEVIDQGQIRHGAVELVVAETDLREIMTFAERI